MKIIFGAVVCVIFVTVVFSAPVAEDGQEETRTVKTENIQVDHQHAGRLDRSFYAVSPCAAPSSNMPVAYAPDTMYQSNFGPLQARYFNSELYGSPDYMRGWYRTEEPYQDSQEVLRYSDGNFVDTAQMGNMFRSAPLSFAPFKSARHYNGQVASRFGGAYGVFPNANVGDCSVPLLFSCSPSIVTGQMMNPDSQGDFDSASPVSGKPSYGYHGAHSHYLQALPSHIDQATNDHASVSSVANHAKNSKVLQ